MAQLQPFLISEFKTGISTYLQPWIRPAEAFEPLTNAYVYRGTVNKRNGFSVYGNRLADHNPVMGIMQFINETTGVASLLVATTVNLYLYTAGPNTFGLVGSPPTFTGTIRNFFNWTNWQASEGASSFLYMVNNKDPITLYDGTNASQPTFPIDSTMTPVTITTCLDVQVYKQRLLLILPTLSVGGAQNQSIYWSAIDNPTNTKIDVAGNGGFLAAPTGDTIVSTEFIRDVLIVFFTNSTWIFRFTGSDSAPFRWDKVNNTKSNNAPYASVAYDERATSLGNTGLIACDGVNVQRYDVSIIDYYEKQFKEQYYAQTFGQRYDNLNQTWMLYVSQGNIFPDVNSVAPGSDSALVYNFLENTWATYTWPIPMTCLGTFFQQSGDTWASLNTPEDTWEESEYAWFSTFNQKSAPILLGGDTVGNVYKMDDAGKNTDNGISIIPDIKSTRWNPSLAAGQKVQFAYVDIYYQKVSTDPLKPIAVTLNFFVDNNMNIATSRILTLDGPVQAGFAFKRIYINLIGEFIQMEIDPSIDSPMQFLGFILWAKPSGRLTP